MNRKIAVFIFSFFAFILVHAQTAAPVAEVKVENALLWKISGKELTEPSYLYGTIHLIGKEDFFLSDSTMAFIRRADKVVFEIDMKEMNNIVTQISLLTKAMMKDGTSLKDLLTEEEYKVVDAHFRKMGLPLFLFERMKPMFLTVFAGMDFSPQAMAAGDMVSYEMKIMELADKGKKKTGGLETVEFQMSVFDSIPYLDQAKMLVESIRTANAGEDEFRKMVELYKNQDINGMVSSMKSDDDFIKYEELLLNSRNKNWIPVMSGHMKVQSTFFAVGAGHLGGINGVITLLRKAGYTLTPIP